MGLVDYSDSEASDTEQVPPPKPAAQPEKTSKPAFNKVVDRANPHKIKVSLPGITNEPDALEDSRPAKKPRVGGGFNSFLPAPKNAAPQAGNTNNAVASKPRAPGLGRGVNLKTGAAPAFSRAPLVEEEHGQYDDESNADVQDADNALVVDKALEVKEDTATSAVQPKKPIFRPLSVARKPDKKKSKATNAESIRAPLVAEKAKSVNTVVAPKPKRSLFASADAEEETVRPDTTDEQYQPFFQDEEPAEPAPAEDAHTTNTHGTAAPNLETLATSLNLTAAQRRQLFGRSGVPTDAQISQFSVSQEYSNNQAMLASGEAAAPAHNPVRSIAPGKHSLQQLLNQANSQKEALEESFAAGKRNKKEAGSRYGW